MAWAGEQCEPVFVTARALLVNNEDPYPDTVEVCLAAEATTGRGTIIGSQRIRGLWRIYSKREQDRNKLLVEGMVFRGVKVELLPRNPFLRPNSTTEEPETRLYIADIPLSVDNRDIETAIKKTCNPVSPMRNELARTKQGALTQFLTGRRFVYIKVPPTPLPSTLQIGIFTATVWHKEQAKKEKSCRRCLISGHLAFECKSELVCKSCRGIGHKANECKMTMTSESALNDNLTGSMEQKGEGEGTGGEKGDAASSSPFHPAPNMPRGPRPRSTSTESFASAASDEERKQNTKKRPLAALTPEKVQKNKTQKKKKEEEASRHTSRVDGFFQKLSAQVGKKITGNSSQEKQESPNVDTGT